MLCLSLKVQRVEAYGTIYIRANGSIDPPTAAITTIDGITYTFTDNIIFGSIVVEKNDIVIDGAGYTLQGTGAYLSKGIRIDLTGKTNVRVQNTQIKNFDYGIWLYYSSNNSIIGNNITNNNYGILLYYSSNNSIIGNNITTNNGYGIKLEWSSNNTIYHNNFDNAQQVIVTSSGYPNVWDDGYPSGGNYWSDYNGTDLFSGRDQNETGRDAIGDTEYFIDGNNTDNYPLMGTFSDFHATPDQHVTTICNSTISDFQFNGTAITFDVTGIEGTIGFCRTCIPTSLLNATYRVFVNGTEVISNLLPCSNSTHSYLYFNYTHSTQEVIIIPEFPSFFILPLIFTALPAAVIHGRKHIQREYLEARSQFYQSF